MLSKGGNKHMRTLNNTEWGGGGGPGKIHGEELEQQSVPEGGGVCLIWACTSSA